MSSANSTQGPDQNSGNSKPVSNDKQKTESKSATNSSATANPSPSSPATSPSLSKVDQATKKDESADKHDPDNPLMLLFGVMASVPNQLAANISPSTDESNTLASAKTTLDPNLSSAVNADTTISQAIVQFANQIKNPAELGKVAGGDPIDQTTQVSDTKLATPSDTSTAMIASLKADQTSGNDAPKTTEPLNTDNSNFAKTLSEASKNDASAKTKEDLTVSATQAASTGKAFINGDPLEESRSANSAQNKDALPAIPTAPQAMAPHEQLPNIAQIAANSGLMHNGQITQAFGSTGWDKAIGQKVLWMVGESIHSAELSLNPPDLGPLQVVLKVSNEHASASFMCAQPEVREALESSLPKLRQMMSDAGIQLSGFSVNTQSSGQGQQGSGYQPSSQHQTTNSRSSAITGEITPVLTAPTRVFTSKIGEVDTFA
ncbi:flagellar hook-length control protein FliK [Undibacterium sp. Dicai25W]|uniref:flagellar hook-length control protein FliK n=1 Tax=Undibacterium sp. Dicai25W TaxID=3413034 RepID=UPI003BEF7C34